jgi:hypothetical protein
VPSTFLGQDNATSGSWIGVYGSDAWDIAGDTTSPNPFATVVMSQHNTYTYEYPSIDPRAPYLGSNPSQRIACVWYNDVSIDINVTVNDGSSHKLSIYALDWDRNGRTLSFTLLDSGGAVLDYRTISDFQEGIYVSYSVSGNTTLRVERFSGANVVLSGMFFDPISVPASTPVGIAAGFLWDTLVSVGLEVSAIWGNRSRSGMAWGSVWGVRAPVGLTRADSWLIAIVPPLDYQAINEYLSTVHGSGLWSEEPPIGTIRIDHDYDVPDRLRVMRSGVGIGGVTIRAFPLDSYRAGDRTDPDKVSGRSITGPDGRWEWDMYLVPGEYILVFDEQSKSAVEEYLNVYTVSDRIYLGPDVTPEGPYRELDTVLSTAHGSGLWGPGSAPRGPSPVDHDYGGPGRFRIIRGGVGIGGTILEIYRKADFAAGRIGASNRVGWSRTTAAGEWEWPVNLYPGTYTVRAQHSRETTIFDIEVT